MIRFFQRQEVFVNLLTVIIIGVGAYLAVTLKREAFPEIAYNYIIIQAVYPGTSPEEMERLVTIPVEDAVANVDGVDMMDTFSVEGLVTLVMQMEEDLSVDELKRAADDMRREIDRIDDYPEEAEDPMVYELSAGEWPLISVSISGDVSETELRRHCRTFEDELKLLPGVGRVDKKGYRERQVWVEADPAELARQHLSLSDLMNALRLRNMNLPGGKVREGMNELIVRTIGEFKTVGDIEQVVLRASDAGDLVRVKDVARVVDTFEDSEVYARVNGTPSIDMLIRKKKDADTIRMAEDVKGLMAYFREKILPQEVKLTSYDDVSFYVKRRLRVLTNNGMVGLVLVVVILLLFLNWRIATMTALGLGVTFMLALIVLNEFGYTINMISMFGFIIVLGMLVDDAIVVSESIFRYLERGEDILRAAYIGTMEVILPVTAAIATTIAAFLPLFLISGIMGKFLCTIPAVVTITLLASLAEAFFVLPCHIITVTRISGADRKTFAKRGESRFDRFRGLYLERLDRVLKRRYLFVISCVLVAIVVIAVLFGTGKLKLMLFPEGMIDVFIIKIKCPRTNTLEETGRIAALVEAEVLKLPAADLDLAITDVGISGYEENQQHGSNHAQVRVYLQAADDRERTADEITEALRPGVEKIEGIEDLEFHKIRHGPPTGEPVNLKVRGDEFDTLLQVVAEIKDYLGSLEGVRDIKDNYQEGKEELRVRVDDARAAYAGVNVGLIAANLRYAVDGGQATTARWDDEDVDIVVKLEEGVRDKPSVLDAVEVPNIKGNLVPLSRLVSVERTVGQANIRRFKRRRTLAVTANLDVKTITSNEVNQLLMEKFSDVPVRYPGVAIDFRGEFEQQMESMASLKRAFAIGFGVVFLILSSAFRSVWQPFIILAVVPFGLFGVAVGLALHGYPLSLMAMIGSCALTGIVVNNSLILVDYVNRERERGLSRQESILSGAGVRLRPIVLTSLTTILGLVPTAYAIGGGEPFIQPCAMAIVWGMAFASIITLFLVPCAYAINDDIAGLFRRKSRG